MSLHAGTASITRNTEALPRHLRATTTCSPAGIWACAYPVRTSTSTSAVPRSSVGQAPGMSLVQLTVNNTVARASSLVRSTMGECSASLSFGVDRGICNICMARPKTVRFRPCGHAACCTECTLELMARPGFCCPLDKQSVLQLEWLPKAAAGQVRLDSFQQPSARRPPEAKVGTFAEFVRAMRHGNDNPDVVALARRVQLPSHDSGVYRPSQSLEAAVAPPQPAAQESRRCGCPPEFLSDWPECLEMQDTALDCRKPGCECCTAWSCLGCFALPIALCAPFALFALAFAPGILPWFFYHRSTACEPVERQLIHCENRTVDLQVGPVANDTQVVCHVTPPPELWWLPVIGTLHWFFAIATFSLLFLKCRGFLKYLAQPVLLLAIVVAVSAAVGIFVAAGTGLTASQPSSLLLVSNHSNHLNESVADDWGGLARHIASPSADLSSTCAAERAELHIFAIAMLVYIPSIFVLTLMLWCGCAVCLLVTWENDS